MTKVSIETNGYKLSGNLYTPDEEMKGGFLFIQGWRGRQNLQGAQALASLGYTSLTYDMRGHGESEGNIDDFSRADYVHDATVTYDYLRERVGEDKPIGVVGSSFGSFTGTMVSAKRDVHCMSLCVPANYPDDGYNEPHASYDYDTVKQWRSLPMDHTRNRALKAIHDFAGKILIIEAGMDDVVHAQTPKNYANAVADKSKLHYELMPNAPHDLASEEHSNDYRNRLVNWVKEL